MSIRVILALATQLDLEIHQMDVDTAFLYGVIKEDIYITQPEGFTDSTHPDWVCHMNRAIYGLKQAPRVWNDTINQYLLDNDFLRSRADPCVYTRHHGGSYIIIALYVDDLVIACSTLQDIDDIKQMLSSRFNMKDLGELQYVLGLQVTRDRQTGTLSLSQQGYIRHILEKTRQQDVRSTSTPSPTGLVLQRPQESIPLPQPYRQAVGMLLYAAIGTRPDIAFPTSVVSRFISCWDLSHWNAVKFLLRYLKGSSDFTIFYDKRVSRLPILSGYSDADWGGDTEDRKSTTGYIFLLCGAPVSWASKKQATIALSSTEAEYLAATQASKEAIWLRHLLHDLGFPQLQPTIIYEDNQSAIMLSHNPVHHARTKHFDIQHHFVREKIESKEIDLIYCPTDDMVADMMTKNLPAVKLQHLRALARMINPTSH